jgi:hypothetical protein
MSEHKTTDDDLPLVTAAELLRGVALCSACDDERLSELTLRAILRDYRDHARRLLGENARAR